MHVNVESDRAKRRTMATPANTSENVAEGRNSGNSGPASDPPASGPTLAAAGAETEDGNRSPVPLPGGGITSKVLRSQSIGDGAPSPSRRSAPLKRYSSSENFDPSPAAIAHLKSMKAFLPVAHIRGARKIPEMPRARHKRAQSSASAKSSSKNGTRLSDATNRPEESPGKTIRAPSNPASLYLSESDSEDSGGIWCSDESDPGSDNEGDGTASHHSQRRGSCLPWINGKRHSPNNNKGKRKNKVNDHSNTHTNLASAQQVIVGGVSMESRIEYYCQLWWQQFTNHFRDTEIEVDTKRVRVHWFSNRFHPAIYESAFVESTIIEGFHNTRGLMFAIWIIAGGYVMNSANKLGVKQEHEAKMYLTYFLLRLIVFALVTLIVAMSSPFVWCQNHEAFYETESESDDVEEGDDGCVIRIEDPERNTQNQSGDRSSSSISKGCCCRPGMIMMQYRNPIWSCLLIIFGCVAMSTKALKYRHEGATVLHNLGVGLNLLESAVFLESRGAVPKDSTLQTLWDRVHPNVTASSSKDWLKILNTPGMNGEMSLRAITFGHNTYTTHEYEVIMNRIWPPLMVVVCTLVIKRFVWAVVIASCVSICWLSIFLSGPLSKDGAWLAQWQELVFQAFIQGIILFGSKTADRKERIDFLNTFGKHLQAERVMNQLSKMREHMNQRVASGDGEGPNTVLGNVFGKLSSVQDAIVTMHARHRKYTIVNGQHSSSDVNVMGHSSEEMMLIDEIKTMLLNNINNLQKPVMSVDALDNVPEEERAWYNEGGAESSRSVARKRRSLPFPAELPPVIITNINQSGLNNHAAAGGADTSEERSTRGSGGVTIDSKSVAGNVTTVAVDEKAARDDLCRNADTVVADGPPGSTTNQCGDPEPVESLKPNVLHEGTLTANLERDEDDSELAVVETKTQTRTGHKPTLSFVQSDDRSSSKNIARTENAVFSSEDEGTGTAMSPMTPRLGDGKEFEFTNLVRACRHHDWNRDTLSMMEQGFNPCLVVGLGICDRHSSRNGFLNRFAIERSTWANFCQCIGEGYFPEREVPYHNAAHGADVMNSVHYILDKAGLRRKRGEHPDLGSAEFFGALVAAMIHDYKHPGVNSQYLRKTRNELSLQYLDDSPLERMHVAEAYMLCAQDPELDIFKNMKSRDYDNVRKVVVTLVLSTDLAHHFPFVERLKLLHRQMMKRKSSSASASVASTIDQGSGKGKANGRISTKSTGRMSAKSGGEMKLDLAADAKAAGMEMSRCSNIDNMTAMKIAIKLSDIGHCAKELSLHKKWTDRVTEEFYRQVRVFAALCWCCCRC